MRKLLPKTTRAGGAAAMLAAALLAAGIVSSSTGAAPEIDQAAKVREVILRTRTTHATYALYNWIRIRHAGGAAVEEWSAEFNSGGRHRVETPRDRLIADCEARTGV